ncbi:MAG: hypothetical protein P8Y91_08225 [Desulfuromonadales bacterium]|jgi:formiminotetrahydrofolate cyclodeaminase
MKDGFLDTIIQLEKQIQAEVATEKKRAEAWRERELAALETGVQAASTEIEERHRQILADKKAAYQEESAALKAATSRWCHNLEELDDTRLREVLQEHLKTILPGGEDDHPHGKG